MDTEPTAIPGCYLVRARAAGDARGRFVKTFHQPRFDELGLRTDWREEYFTFSQPGVLRGMHFQTPPAEHAKLVFCLTGEVLDVVLDLRAGSPAFGQGLGLVLSEANAVGVYIPSGCAHGFLAREAAGMMYKVTSVHAPEHDSGIAWDSFGFAWPVYDPMLSQRDLCHPPLGEFATPFAFDDSRAAR